MKKTVEIYIDGACSGNPGPGGWAAVCKQNGKNSYVAGSELKTTNNRMELSGAIGALGALNQPCQVILYTDSKYLCDCYSHDVKWLTSASRPNRDLWIELLKKRDDGKHELVFKKVHGHSGDKMNELADKYAKIQIKILMHSIVGG